jgi:hypothetical protein
VNPRITLIVVALFALLLGYVYFAEINKPPAQLGTPVPTPAPQVFSLSSSNVKSIEVRDLRRPRQVTISRTENTWQITNPETKPADSTQVDSTLMQLTTLQATRVLTNVTNLAPYGLITATLEVRLVMSDTTSYAITVGDKTPDGSSYYAVYTGDTAKVFLISSSTVDQFNTWLTTPPYEPTATPTATATPPVTPTVAGTESPPTTPAAGSTAPPPNLVPTIALPVASPTP